MGTPHAARGHSNNNHPSQLNRKARRKQERKARKQKRARGSTTTAEAAVPPTPAVTVPRPTKRRKRQVGDATTTNHNDPYAHVTDPAVVAALRRDDAEIAQLAQQLGVQSGNVAQRLNAEYARHEGYGDDFGDFLQDLDDLVHRVTATDRPATGSRADPTLPTHDEDEDSASTLDDPYRSSSDDDDDDDDDALYPRDANGQPTPDALGEEILPMKGPAWSEQDPHGTEDSDKSQSPSETNSETDSHGPRIPRTEETRLPHDNGHRPNNNNNNDDDDDNDAESEHSSPDDQEGDSDASSDSSDASREEPEHEEGDTYKPIAGEDIYGNSKETTTAVRGGKYVPPHLRTKPNEPGRQEALRSLERLLNNPLNRLSQDTVISVAQAIAKLYDGHPKSDVNDTIWKIARNTCVERTFLMTGLVPVYVAALVGVHYCQPHAQLAEHLMELVATQLYTALSRPPPAPDQDPEAISKRACNLALVLGYLYNYGVLHCSLLYDVIRKLIERFHEIDVEVLLIFLAHCGRSLRSDDPLALKEIVLEVQQRTTQTATASSSSRVDYMLSAMMDLKNNKRRPQDVALAERTSKLRKSIGHIKSKVAATSHGKANDTSLRLTLQDVLDAETKGRWWRVGASWAGNQYKFHENEPSESDKDNSSPARPTPLQGTGATAHADAKLLQLAAKYRMNTDIRRSIFCIIMGAADCDDAFEKIVRAGVLKNKNERDAVRVLMECCGNEKTYNKFYEHLANRFCEYQSRCRFTFQLAFWDIFKQFDDMKLRKAANLAKLLFSLVVQHQVLRLNVLKAIDMTIPEDLSETATIFLTIFFSNMMEYFDDEDAVTAFFESSIHQRRGNQSEEPDDTLLVGHGDEADALRASFTLFFVQVLKASPKYKKGSTFRANLKAAIKACDTENFF